jgi:hypothetical protein
MKIVVQWAPDEVEKALSELDEESFIVDQETFCHFRDEVFINSIEKFIKKTTPGKWKEMENHDGAEKVKIWYDNQALIYRYYKSFKKRQPKFHLYKNSIYSYNFLGFMNVGNEIQLMKLEIVDIIGLLNRSTESVLKKHLPWSSPYFDRTHT